MARSLLSESITRLTVIVAAIPTAGAGGQRWAEPSSALARRHTGQHATFTTLLMCTGLTFGTISALYGLNAHIINRTQFSLLVTVVVLSAILPTAIAQRWFSPPAYEPGEHPHHLLPPEPSEILTGEPT
jgi:hypothetical protein